MHPVGTATQYMGIDLGGLYILVSQQLLHGADIVAAFQQMRGEGMPQRMTGCHLVDARAFACHLHSPANGRRIDMMPPFTATNRIDGTMIRHE
jgi:hypothetical protein